jgi:hypothetical protein
MVKMKIVARKLARLTVALFLLMPLCASAQKVELFPLEQVKPGMKGVARTIFAGDQIEDIELEIIGVMPNAIGPKQDLILALLKGAKVEFTGVVSGMSGSPVYIDGKLAGALSYRMGIFAKEPLAGITPIRSVFAVDDPAPPLQKAEAAGEPGGTNTELLAGASLRPQIPLTGEFASRVGGGGAFLAPIETPVMISGFRQDSMARFRDQLMELGMVAAPGGATDARPDDADLKPGDMVGMVLVRGDLSMAAGCTVTAIVDGRVFVCGHPVLAHGRVDMPMTRGRVLTTASSAMASTKLMNNGGVIGAITQDRLTAVMGRLGGKSRLIPVELTLGLPGGEQKLNFEVIENPKMTPLLVAISVFNGLTANTAYSEGMSFQLSGGIQLKGFPAVNLENMFAPTDMGVPDGLFVALTVQSIFHRIFTNPYEKPQIEKVALRVEAIPERRTAAIESAWSEKSEVSPGEIINIKVLLRGYRGAPYIREVPISIPPQAPRGPLRVMVSDSDSLNRVSRFFSFSPQSRLPGLGQLITLLNRERRNSRLYVTLLQPSPTLLLEDKELPNAPLSQINVLDQRRTGGSALLLRESIAGEWSLALHHVVTGQQSILITVR